MPSVSSSPTSSPSDAPASSMAHVSTPLSGNTELEIISTPLTSPNQASHVEYRVYNYQTLKTGRIVRGDGWDSIFLLAGVALSFIYLNLDPQNIAAELRNLTWATFHPHKLGMSLMGLVAILHLHNKTKVVLYQSVVPLPQVGIQLSTTRGLSLPRFLTLRPERAGPRGRSLWPMSTTKAFIPLEDISTVVINEGLTKWSVRYYLSVIRKNGAGVAVAFDAVSPRHPVLQEVYHGIRESLFDEWDAKL